MFPDRQWIVDRVKSLFKKTDITVSIDQQVGSGRPSSARMSANINELEGLTLSQEDKPQTHNCAKDWHVFGLSQHNHQE